MGFLEFVNSTDDELADIVVDVVTKNDVGDIEVDIAEDFLQSTSEHIEEFLGFVSPSFLGSVSWFNIVEVGRLLLLTSPPDIYYKCHPQKVVSVVMSVVCNSIYHKSDCISKKTKRNYLNGLEMICDEHNIDDITSKDPRVALPLLRRELENSRKQNNLIVERNEILIKTRNTWQKI